jgi:hypothetical protein
MVNITNASSFIARLLHGVTAIHMHHLTVMGHGSYAAHMALGDLYAELQEKTDALAEEVMGCYDIGLQFAGTTFSIGDNPIADVAQLYEYVEGTRGALGYESHIQNSVDGICTSLASALYKLRRLQ